MSIGWIKLHRGITDHWVWKDDPYTRGQAWIDLLLHANFADTKIIIKGQIIIVRRGQQARSELTLSKEWNWSRGKVRRFLAMLKKHSMIEQQTDHLTSIITICNYESFQADDTSSSTTTETSSSTAGEHLTDIKRTSDGTQNKKDKKNKNEKKERSYTLRDFKKSLHENGARDDLVDAWVTVRKAKKAVNTEIALNKFLTEVKKSGRSINEVLTHCIQRSWAGFDSSWPFNPSFGANHQSPDQSDFLRKLNERDGNIIEGDYSHE